MFKVGVFRYICTFPKIGRHSVQYWDKDGVIRYKTLKRGSLGNTPQLGVIGYRFARSGSMSTKRLNLLKYILLMVIAYQGDSPLSV